MEIHVFKTPALGISSYLLIDSQTNQAAAIDPTRDISSMLAALQAKKCSLKYILETHVHADFISGAKELKAQLHREPLICCSGTGGEKWIPSYTDIVIQHLSYLSLGALRLEAWKTPGHTPEHITWIVYEERALPVAFTGDFLFVGSVGRPDLLGKEETQHLAHELYETIFKVLPKFPENLTIYPSHGAGSACGKSLSTQPSSTLDKEKKSNPYLTPKDEKTWQEQLFEQMPRAPSYFSRMKQINVQGAPLLKDIAIPSRQETLSSKNTYLLDLRSYEAFSKQHLKGAVNIPFGGSFLNWAAEILPPDQPLTLIAEDEETVREAIRALQIVGLDHIQEYLIWPFSPQLELVQLSLISPAILQADLAKYQILDVRTTQEWNHSHIASAIHIPLPELPKHLDRLSKEAPLAVICGSGYRSSIGASLLQKEGFQEVANVKGGMQAWSY